MRRKRRAEPTTPLMQGLHFSHEDLHANREGRLSDSQLRRLHRLRMIRILILVGALMMLPLLIAPFIERFVGLLIGVVSLTSFSLWANLGLALMSFGAVWWASHMLAQINHDIHAQVVHIIEGNAYLDSAKGHFIVGTQRFYVPRHLFTFLTHNAHYRVYYAPRVRILLGLEPLVQS